MIWRFYCYNGTVWEHYSRMPLAEAVELFKKETGLSEMDIEKIISLA